MHKDYYASGFIYHPKSQQILLQQHISASTNPVWTLLGKKVEKDLTGEETFKELLLEAIKLKIKLTSIKIIYSYFSKELNAENNVYYAEVSKLYKTSSSDDITYSWFTLKKIQKLNISEQTKQDIIIGQRVIDSSVRKSLGLRTIG
ncbi:MAG: hypothetical protein AAB532_01885 [Patescibacteria group bacterium]